MITEVYIGTSQCDYKDELNVDYAISDIRNLTGRNIPKSLSIKLPMTATNKEIFKFVNEANVFTEITDIGEIYIDGGFYIGGKVNVLETNTDYFKIIISHKGWIDNLTDVKIADLDWSNDDHTYDKSTMDDSENPDITSQFVHSTDTKGWLFPFAADVWSPTVYYYNKKTYQPWMQRKTDGYNCRAMIWAYNHKTGTESANYDLHTVSQPTTATDSHVQPSVIVADDGHIIVVHEYKRPHPQTHNDAFVILRSDNVEDETSWVNAKAETANYYTTVGDSSTIRLAYPNLIKDSNGYLYIIARRYISGGNHTRIFKSTDHGITWDAGYDITYSGNTDYWHYPVGVSTGTGNVLRYMIRWWNDNTGRYEKVYYLESHDQGVTWRDVSGSHSQNIVTGGAISQANLDNGAYDYLVTDAASVGHDGLLTSSGTVNDDGIPFICTLEFDDPVVDYGYRMLRWNGSNWVNSIIKDNVNIAGDACLIHKRSNEFDCYITEEVGGNNNLYLYSTTNLTTWSKTRDVKDTSGLTEFTFMEVKYTFNYKDADFWMLIGAYGTDAAYSDIFVEIQSKKNYLYPVIDYGEFKEVDSNLVTNMGTITAAANYAAFVAGKVKMTDVGHGLYTDDVIKQNNTTDYDGIFSMTRIDDDSYYITETWNADRSGWWQRRARVRIEHRFSAVKILGILENIFTYVGYTLTSTFKDSTAFKRLYIPYVKARPLYTEEFKTDKEFRAGLSATDSNRQDLAGAGVVPITVLGSPSKKTIPINDDNDETQPYFDNGSDFNTGTYKYVIPTNGSYNFISIVRFISDSSHPGIDYTDGAGNPDYPICKLTIVGDSGDLATRQYYELTTDNHVHKFYIETGQLYLTAGDSIYLQLEVSGFVDDGSVAGDLDVNITATTTVFYNEMGSTYANGQSITFSEMLPDVYCMDFLKGIIHTHNLVIFTDILNKTVYIEERDSFYTSEEIDWSAKTDRHQKVSQIMISNDYQKFIRFKYKDDSNDEELVKWEEDNSESADSYLHTLSSEYVKIGEGTKENPVFAATIQMVQRDIGFLTDTIPAIKGDNEQLLPKVIDYIYDAGNFGPTDLTGSERWEFEGDIRDTYPKFNTLDYEDLYNDYYFNDIELIDKGKIIIAYMVLDSNEYQKFITVVDDTTKEGFRPIYKIDIDDTVTYCRINRIVTNGKKTKVEFIKIKYQE